MNKTSALILAIAASSVTLGIGGAAMAQPQQNGGQITRAAAETRAAAQFARMDANSDGVLNAADREARMRARFDAQDTNGDGQLSFAEVQAAQSERQAGRRASRGEDGNRSGRRGMRGGGEMRGMMMQRADSDGDGAISQAEFTATALARFDRTDADSDGTITAEERQAMRESRQGGRHGRHRGGAAE